MRRNDLDYARGLAILMIVVGHTNGILPFSEKLIYSVHVPLFFMISGILMHHNHTAQRSWKRIGQGWLSRIIAPTVIWEAVLSVFYFFIKDIPPMVLLKNSLTLNFNLSVLWFIPCLLAAQVLWLAILMTYGRELPSVLCATGMLAAAVAAQFMGVLFLKRILVAFVFIGFGYGIDALVKSMGNDLRKRIAGMLLSLTVWLPTFFYNVRADLSAGILGNPILYYLHSICGSFAVIMGCGLIRRELPLLHWIGNNTMGILVTHVFVRHAVIAVEERLFGRFYGGWSLALLIILIDLTVVWVIGRIVPEVFGNKRKQRQELNRQ